MKTLAFRNIYAAKRRQACRFFRVDEDGGTTTIEFILWLPIFIVIIALVVDVCFLMLCQAVMFDAASDVARRFAAGTFASTAAAVTYGKELGTFSGSEPTVTVNYLDNFGTVEVEMIQPLAQVDVFGIFSLVSGSQITVSVTQMMEARLPGV